MKQLIVYFYTKDPCPLCEDARMVLEPLADELPIAIHEVDIHMDDELLELYQLKIPVIWAAGQELGYGQFNLQQLRARLQRLLANQ